MKKRRIMQAVVLVLFLLPGVLTAEVFAQERQGIIQVATINALLQGYYDGEVTVAELRRYGSLGIGTFNALDGEMVILEGRVYQVTADGKARPVPDDVKTPFAAVIAFAPEKAVALPRVISFQELQSRLDRVAPNPNLFYAFRIDGLFKLIKVRSVPRQNRPYRPLVEVTKNQPVYVYRQVQGTIVGFRCPAYVKGINVPGWHLHFLSEDRKHGGHLLEVSFDKATALIDQTEMFSMILPAGKTFGDLDLTTDRESEVRKVEK